MSQSRTTVAVLATLVLAVGIGAGGSTAGSTVADTRQPSRVQVVEKEFLLTLSRQRVLSGAVIVQVINFGMDNHDLLLQSNVKGSKPIRFEQLAPGAHATRTLKLASGRYTLWCSLPGHRQRGMVTRLIVG
jgi:hypothetical protein